MEPLSCLQLVIMSTPSSPFRRLSLVSTTESDYKSEPNTVISDKLCIVYMCFLSFLLRIT